MTTLKTKLSEGLLATVIIFKSLLHEFKAFLLYPVVRGKAGIIQPSASHSLGWAAMIRKISVRHQKRVYIIAIKGQLAIREPSYG
jgi:hypothetical protein